MSDIDDVLRSFCDNKDRLEEKLILARRFLYEISASLQKEDDERIKGIIPKIESFLKTFYSEEEWYENDHDNVKDLILWLKHGNAGRPFLRPGEIEKADEALTSAIIEGDLYIDVPRGVIRAGLNEIGEIMPGSWCFYKSNGADNIKIKIFKKTLRPKDDLLIWLRWGNDRAPFILPQEIEDAEDNVTVEVLGDMIYVDSLENTACTNLNHDGTILIDNWCYMKPDKIHHRCTCKCGAV